MRSRRGFTLVEFMVLLGIGLILVSIFIPYLLRLREDSRRALCASNLRQIGEALVRYSNENGKNFPRVVYDEQNLPTGYRAFTGADDDNPFAPGSGVQPNDVTASLWLLVRNGLDPAVFICPGSDDSRDLMTDAAGRFVNPPQRGNFRRPSNLSYS
jgi:type II secretory pathway pseudopilin PulG